MRCAQINLPCTNSDFSDNSILLPNINERSVIDPNIINDDGGQVSDNASEIEIDVGDPPQASEPILRRSERIRRPVIRYGIDD